MRGIRIYLTCGTVDRASELMVQRERKQHFEPASRAARGFNLTSMHLDGSQCNRKTQTCSMNRFAAFHAGDDDLVAATTHQRPHARIETALGHPTQCPTQVLQWTSKAFGFIT